VGAGGSADGRSTTREGPAVSAECAASGSLGFCPPGKVVAQSTHVRPAQPAQAAQPIVSEDLSEGGFRADRHRTSPSHDDCGACASGPVGRVGRVGRGQTTYPSNPHKDDLGDHSRVSPARTGQFCPPCFLSNSSLRRPSGGNLIPLLLPAFQGTHSQCSLRS
jgi:hypothetical protein